jgi:hypothetical protein
MMLRIACWASICGLTLSAEAALADPDRNAQVMTEAARQLTWEAWAGNNHAYFLMKQETVLAPVAVVFGYADNAVACEALAQTLSQPKTGVGTFKCQPVF